MTKLDLNKYNNKLTNMIKMSFFIQDILFPISAVVILLIFSIIDKTVDIIPQAIITAVVSILIFVTITSTFIRIICQEKLWKKIFKK